MDEIFGLDENMFEVPFKIDSILYQIQINGIAVPQLGRFRFFKRNVEQYILKSKLGIEVKEEEIRNLLEGYKDYRELSFIASSMTILDKGKADVAKIFKGNILPEDDNEKSSFARNYQYQLYLSSKFERANFPLILAEPDFIFQFKRKSYYVAAKRITSFKKIELRIKEAQFQIEKQKKHYGFIALCLDQLYPKEERYPLIGYPDKSIFVAKNLIERVLRDYFHPTYFEERSNQVLGIIASISFPFILPQKWEEGTNDLGYASYTMFLPLAKDGDAEWNEATSICDKFNFFNC